MGKNIRAFTPPSVRVIAEKIFAKKARFPYIPGKCVPRFTPGFGPWRGSLGFGIFWAIFKNRPGVNPQRGPGGQTVLDIWGSFLRGLPKNRFRVPSPPFTPWKVAFVSARNFGSSQYQVVFVGFGADRTKAHRSRCKPFKYLFFWLYLIDTYRFSI